MTTTIGRAVFTNAPQRVSWSGEVLTLAMQIKPASLEEAKAKAQQMLGLVNNPDEPVIPVTSTDDPSIDGFYAPLDVSCDPMRIYLFNKTMQVSIGLRRVANGYQNPIIETYVVSRLVTNSHSVLSTTDYALAAAWRATAGSTSEQLNMDLTGLGALTVGFGSAGSVALSDGTEAAFLPFNDTNAAGYWSRYGLPSAYYAVPSCKIEYLVSGTWYDAVGRQIPSGVAWRINNGVVRVGPSSALPTSTILVEGDTSWTSSRGVDLGAVTAGNFVASAYRLAGESGPFILRNSPEVCVLRVQMGEGRYATYSVWRGGTIATIAMSSTTAMQLGLGLSSGAAGTNVTGGIRMTTADASGNRLVLLSRSAVSTDTADTGMSTTSTTTSAVFSVGWYSGFADYTAEAAQLGQLCTPPQWSQRVAAR